MTKRIAAHIFLYGLLVFFFLTFALFSLAHRVRAYDQLGSGVCECNSCSDCTSAIADDVNCTDTVRLTTDITDVSSTCIDNPIGSNKVFDCQNNTIDGDDSFIYGVHCVGDSGCNDITIQNCTITDFDEGILFINGTGEYVAYNNTINSCRHGIRALYNNEVTLTQNDVGYSTGLGIGVSINTLATLIGNNAHDTILSPQTYHISQFQNGIWNEIQKIPFTPSYTAKTFSVHEQADTLKLRFVQRDTLYGGIESIKLSMCGRQISPSYATYIDTGEDITSFIKDNDLFVVDAHDKTIEVGWNVPLFCSFPLFVTLNANEYGEGLPMLFPDDRGGKLPSYMMGTHRGTVVADGLVTSREIAYSPLYAPVWKPTTGHPQGTTYVYAMDDDVNVYFSFDITSDNTDEYGKDWIEVTVFDEEMNDTVFRVDDFDTTYGKCGFGKSNKVQYPHAMCELAIPKDRIAGDIVHFSVRYYGTEAIDMGGSGIYIDSGTNVLTNNISNDNATVGIFINDDVGSSTVLNNNSACGNGNTDIYGYLTAGTESGDNNTCLTTQNWDDEGATGCTYVCDDTPPIFVQLPGGTQVINVTNGQIITVNPYTIKVKPEDQESGITRVEFYIDDVLICTVTTPDVNGVYSCYWDTATYHSEIRVVAYNGNDTIGSLTQTAFVQLPTTGVDVGLYVVIGAFMLMVYAVSFAGKRYYC